MASTDWIPDPIDRGETCGMYRRADGETRVLDVAEFRNGTLHDARHPPKWQQLSRPRCPSCRARGRYDGRVMAVTIGSRGILWRGAILSCRRGHEWDHYVPTFSNPYQGGKP